MEFIQSSRNNWISDRMRVAFHFHASTTLGALGTRRAGQTRLFAASPPPTAFPSVYCVHYSQHPNSATASVINKITPGGDKSPSKKISKYLDKDHRPISNKMESLVQPNRKLMFFETANELEGSLEVPDRPEVSAGYADIYHGVWIDPQGNRVDVAIKELKDVGPKDPQTSPEALIMRQDIRMKREVFVWGQTAHPNLHPLLGYHSQPRPRLISPWCRHGNLTHYLGKNPRLHRLQKLRLVFQAACGLEHLHAQKPPICHADIKPENVLVNDILQAALSDFGLSRVLDVFGHRSGFTTSEGVKGTYNYIAPELFNDEKPRPTPETDVYAFGGLILNVMSGKPPFYDLPQPTIFRRVILDQPPRQEDHQNLPPDDPLWSLMYQCWDFTPKERLPMKDVLTKLWDNICEEELDFWSGLGLSPITGNDDADFSHMDLDTLGETATAEAFAVLNHGPVPVHIPVPNVSISGGKAPRGVDEGTLGEARKVLQVLGMDSGIIGRYIAAFGDVGSILLEFAHTMDRNVSVANSMARNALELVGRIELLQEESRQGDGLAARVADVQTTLRCIQRTIEDWCSVNLFLSAFSTCDQTQGLKRCERLTKKLMEEICLLATLDAAEVVMELSNREAQKERQRLLDRLGGGNYGIKGNTTEDVTCFPGTRVDILDRVDDWVADLSGSERALWVRGMAGRGKSTIASTVALRWKFRGSCAIFHFRRGQDALNSRMACSIARQLGCSLVSEVKKAVLDRIRENEDIADGQLSEQFQVLLVATLGKLKGHPYPILIIVDALDECQDSKYALDLVRLIHRHSSSFPANVKFLLTCRPEAALLRALEPNEWNTIDLDSEFDISDDLSRFIQHACSQVRDHHGLAESWPSPEDLLHLVDMSQGLFQWARTAITYINNGSPVDRLRDLVQRPEMLSGLDPLYHEILSKAMNNVMQDPKRQQILCSVLGALVVAPHPVSLEAIAVLCDAGSDIFPDDITQYLRKDILVDLNSLLHIPTSPGESVRFMHTSIRDLLVNKQRCRGKLYCIDTIKHHQRLADSSLGYMLTVLKENIGNLSDFSQKSWEIQDIMKSEVFEALRYCCRSWSIHMTEGLPWSESNEHVTRSRLAAFELFSKEKILGWIEVMSLIRATSEGITIAKQVHHWLVRCPGEIFGSDSLIRLWSDVDRFIASFLEPISCGPLHIYASALPHCPHQTELWRLYGSCAKVRALGSSQMATWPSNRWTRATGGTSGRVAFSADGSVVIAPSELGVILYFDTETGRETSRMQSECKGTVSSISVSPDGKLFALGYTNKTIRLWDFQGERQFGQPLTGHGSYVYSVCFSADGRLLASGSEDVRLWDPKTGRLLGKPLTGHSDWVYSVCFSPDGKLLASGSDCVRLWDIKTGRLFGRPLTGHSDWVYSVCFSPDGRLLVSGSRDMTIRLWDPQTGRQLGEPLTDHNCGVSKSICFSPDGRVLASGSTDKTIRLWDTQTWRQLGKPLRAHSSVLTLCFSSSDGKFLASGHIGNTAQLWDPQIGGHLAKPFINCNNTVHSVCTSSDSTALASGPAEETIQPQDSQATGMPDEPPTYDSGTLQPICFSPDGKTVASAFRYMIQLWDSQTGRQLGKPLIKYGGVDSLCFSPDGRILASGSRKSIQLWDPQTGRQLSELLVGSEYYPVVTSVCFSPDGRVLASGFTMGAIELWNPHTGMQLGKRLYHGELIRSVCFSPNGEILASSSTDKTVRLWNPKTGKQLGEPLSGRSPVFSLHFSPDGMFIVGQDIGGCIIWNALTGKECHSPPILPCQITVRLRDHWLALSPSRLLWLPEKYWNTSNEYVLHNNNKFAIAHGTSISIFDLSMLL